MSLVKRLSKKRKQAMISQMDNARLALDVGDLGSCLYALDKAMKLANGLKDDESAGLRYDELNDACDAFLEKVKLPTLAVAINYINHWREQEPLAKLGQAAYDAECDMTHYWRCEAWADEKGDRRRNDPHPSDEKCSCGLKEITECISQIYEREQSNS